MSVHRKSRRVRRIEWIVYALIPYRTPRPSSMMFRDKDKAWNYLRTLVQVYDDETNYSGDRKYHTRKYEGNDNCVALFRDGLIVGSVTQKRVYR